MKSIHQTENISEFLSAETFWLTAERQPVVANAFLDLSSVLKWYRRYRTIDWYTSDSKNKAKLFKEVDLKINK